MKGAEKGNTEPEAEARTKHEEAKPKRRRTMLDAVIYICGALVLVGCILLSYLGVAGGIHNQRMLALKITYATLFFVLTGAFFYFYQNLKEAQAQPQRTERAVMSFVRTNMTPEFGDNEPVETIFWFNNNGDITARDVTMIDCELLVIGPDNSCIRQRPGGGPRDIGRGEEYNVRAILSGFIFRHHTIQMRGTLSYIASTDVYGTPIRDTVPFCQESKPVGPDGKVRWLSCIGAPYPDCREYGDRQNPN